MSLNSYIWIAIFVMAAVTYALRVLPITLIRKQITNGFIKSVLYYLPYVTLAVMIVPAIFEITDNPICGLCALIVSGVIAWFTSNLFLSAFSATGVVLLFCYLL